MDVVCLFYATWQSDKSNCLTPTTQFAPPEGQLSPSVRPRLRTSIHLPRLSFFFFLPAVNFALRSVLSLKGIRLHLLVRGLKQVFFFFSQRERVSSNKSKTWSSLSLLQNALCREPKRLQLQSVSYTTLSTFFPLKWFQPQTLTG